MTDKKTPQGKSLKPLRHLAPYLLRYRGLAVGAVVFLLIAAATALALPLAVRLMIDQGFSTADSVLISDYVSVLLLVVSVLALSSACRYYFVILLGERVVSDLRRDVFSHVLSLSPRFFDSTQSGEIVSRLAADATQIKSAVGATASMALRNSLLGIGSVIMMIITSPKLSGLVLAAIPVIVIPLIGFGRSVRRRTRSAQDNLAAATAYASEQISAVRTVQAFTNEPSVRQRFSTAIETAFSASKATIRARAILTFFSIFTIFASVIAVLWFGTQDVLNGDISPGTLGQFLLYSVFAASALGALSEVWGELSQAAGAAERLTELLLETPDIQSPAQPQALPAPCTQIRFDQVTFAYPSRPEPLALKNVSFEVKNGETLAIVGASGAGKSTLFSLLLRYYDPLSGQISMSGQDIRHADLTCVREQIAIVPQEATLYAASARDNIAYGRADATKEQIHQAARAAHAEEFISQLKHGYDTQLGERGVTLSGGQRQRIAIARALLRDAPILLLDEATSALDAQSERLVQDALEHLMHGRTTLVIAHRLATVLKADRILVFDQAELVEQGTHKELIAKQGIYARLAALQLTS